MKKNIGTILIAFAAGLGGAYTFTEYNDRKTPIQQHHEKNLASAEDLDLPNNSGFATSVNTRSLHNETHAIPDDFVEASDNSTKSVVYIKNISSKTYNYSFFDWFFEESGRSVETVSSGSGVIISSQGHIVTNNHVVKGSDKLEVVHNKNTYQAQLIGTDPSSDLAVLKVESNNLPAIKFGNSRDLKVGEWVIAVGNPFNLTSTVTAGIVSAKGRELNILKGKFPIESFIQTDAAINPGNSGGALVNKRGELVGINTAIVSRTGSYAGYGFAVPSDVVKKIVNDIIEYGEVQKAFFGANVLDLNSEAAKKFNLTVSDDQFRGAIIDFLQNGGAAATGQLRKGDIILKIDDNIIDSKADFEEVLSYYSPGNIITVTYKRDGKELEKRITLTNREGTTELLKRTIFTSEFLGGELETVSKVERDLLKIEHGVRVVKVFDRGLLDNLGLEAGFIVTYVNYTKIREPEDLVQSLRNLRGRVKLEGVDPGGRKGYYNFYLR